MVACKTPHLIEVDLKMVACKTPHPIEVDFKMLAMTFTLHITLHYYSLSSGYQ